MVKFRDIELARKMREDIQELMREHQRAVSIDCGSQELTFVRGDRWITVSRRTDSFIVSICVGGMLVAQALVDKNDQDDKVNLKPSGLRPWGKVELSNTLNSLGGYRVLVGLDHPYGYISGHVVAIFMRASIDGGRSIALYTLNGMRPPALDLFDRLRASDKWSDRFWQLVRCGNIVPLREGQELSGWKLGYPIPTQLDVSGLTSNMHLLASGRYLRVNPVSLR